MNALGRVLSKSDAGGGSTNVFIHEERVLGDGGGRLDRRDTKRRQLEYDSLGRFDLVCELNERRRQRTAAERSRRQVYWAKIHVRVWGTC